MNKIKMSLLTSLLPALMMPMTATSAPMVELFTSQGCYSCPPADEFLGDLLEAQPDVVALEFHVDYWDDLRYGSHGVWKDPFSSPAYSNRQRRYNSVGLDGNRGVYTPQMIVNGKTAQVGSSRGKVLRALEKQVPEVEIAALVKDNELAVEIQGTGKGGPTLWLAFFDRLQVTEVERGENHGKTMVNHHVVSELVPLGRWQGDEVSQTFQLPASAGFTGADSVENGERGCALFLQDEALGQVYGATYCETAEG